jgi:hypothetical protein
MFVENLSEYQIRTLSERLSELYAGHKIGVDGRDLLKGIILTIHNYTPYSKFYHQIFTDYVCVGYGGPDKKAKMIKNTKIFQDFMSRQFTEYADKLESYKHLKTVALQVELRKIIEFIFDGGDQPRVRYSTIKQAQSKLINLVNMVADPNGRIDAKHSFLSAAEKYGLNLFARELRRYGAERTPTRNLGVGQE